MNTRRFSAALLGFLLVGPSLFAQTPPPRRPATPLWRVQPQEKRAQQQAPKVGGNLAKAQIDGLATKRAPGSILKPQDRPRPRIYRTMRDVSNVK
jgi:hypothetical protein